MIKRVDRGTSVSTFCDGNAQTILKLLWNSISSVHEDLPMPTNAPYCASEGGLRMLARTISVELAKYNITVNNIAPGAIYTRIDADIEAKPELEKALMAEIPVNRWGEPEDVAGLAVYLASDEAGYVTGSTYFIDGGMLQQSGSY
jgi:glucose 1-dehydrogenase